MPPHRNRVNNKANPAFTAMVAQAVADLLPTLTAHITDEIRQNENNRNNVNRRNARCVNSGGSGNDGDAQPTDIHAENWIAHIEKIFEVLGCGDQFKARLETYKLEGDAYSWWRAYKQAKGGDAYMPPRRNRVNNEANPAFTATVAQAVADLLPTLTAHITDEIRQNENNRNNVNRRNARCVNSGGSGNDGDAQPTDIHFKARLATYKLEGDAHSWWRAYKQAKGGDAYVATLSWNDFRDIFFLQYFPYSEKEKILNTEFTDVAQVANAARNIDIFRDRNSKRYGNNDRYNDRQGNSDRHGNNRQSSWRDRDQHVQGQPYSRSYGSSSQRGNSNQASIPTCNQYGKRHLGDTCYKATCAYFICGQGGHLAKDCGKNRGVNNTGNGNNRQHTTRGRVSALTTDQAAKTTT
ncbi:retrotransposon protein, putative, ty3-gypsy subclass [Tanacetum coccineum]